MISPKEQAEQLMEIDNEIWDAHGWRSADYLLAHWNEYKIELLGKLEERDVRNLALGTAFYLRGEKYHALADALAELFGDVGDDEFHIMLHSRWVFHQ